MPQTVLLSIGGTTFAAMDSLTHIVVGACVGELIGGKKLGKKAMLIGAIGNSLPDIDFVCSFFMSPTGDLLAHRGFTHSILFAVLVSPLLGWATAKLLKDSSAIRFLSLFWGAEILLHDFIDAFNAYGTGWFEPFSHYRVAFNTMFVADPLFTLWPLAASILLIARPRHLPQKRRWAASALLLSALYLASGIAFKTTIDCRIRRELATRNIPQGRYFSTPTPLNNILWYIVAESDSGFYIGYRSLFDKDSATYFRYACRNAALLNAATNRQDIDRLVRFSQGFYTVELVRDTLRFNDLRFGEILGWADTVSHCVFYYYPQLPGANDLVVQRGRFAKWDGEKLRQFIRRIGAY